MGAEAAKKAKAVDQEIPEEQIDAQLLLNVEKLHDFQEELDKVVIFFNPFWFICFLRAPKLLKFSNLRFFIGLLHVFWYVFVGEWELEYMTFGLGEG